MSNLTYSALTGRDPKVLVWLKDKVRTPPFSVEAKREAGALLRQLQQVIAECRARLSSYLAAIT